MDGNIYSVFDIKVGAYIGPFVSHNDSTAIREFANAIADPDHNFHKHSHDYALFRIGKWEAETGKCVSTAREQIAQAHELKAQLDLPIN